MPIKKEKLDSIKGYREYQNKQGRAANIGSSAPASVSPTASDKKAAIKPEKRKEIYTYYRMTTAPALDAAAKRAASPMFRTQENAVAPKNQSALAQNLAQGALQKQDAKNYQSKEALEQHAQNAKEQAAQDKESRTLKGRIKNTAKGAAKTYAAGLVNIAGVAQNSSGLQRREEANTEIALWNQDIKAQQDVLADPASTESERDTARNVIAALEARKAAYLKAYGAGGETERTAKNIYKAADRLNDSGSGDIERAKQGLGAVGQLAVDTGVAGAQMAADATIGALTGFGALVPMAIRSAGGSAQQARREGATHEQQINYGILSGGLSVATEKIGNAAAPFKKMFGKGFLDDVIERATQNLTRSAAGKIVLSFLEEGGEEVIEDLVQPALQTIYNGKTMGGSYSELEAAEVLNDFLVGGILGGLGGAVEAAQRRGDYDSGTKLPDAEADRQRGIKKAPLDGESRDQKAASLDVSSGAISNPTVAQNDSGVKIQDMQNGAQTPLQNAAEADTMSKGTFSLKEEPKNGRAREESRDNFLRRAPDEGYRVLEGDPIAYGYRSDKPVLGNETGTGQIQKELGGAEPAEAAGGINESITTDAARTLFDGDAKRGERGSIGRETERIPKEVRNVGGEDGNALTVQKRIAASGISQFISPREAKVPNGTGGENTVTVFREADWDQELISAASWAKSKGVKKVTALLGVINVEKDGRSGSIFGAFDADTGEIFVNASSMQRSVSETIEHETAHYLSEMARRENVRAFMRDIQGRYSSEEWSKVYDAYFDRYAGLTGDYAGMNESDIELYVWEEIMSDAYAEIDQYEQQASRFNREAENALTPQEHESKTASQSSSERAAAQGQETAAAMERRTGPPERYSIGEIEGKEQDYGDGVILDTNIFDGVRPREWGKVLSQYVYQNMAGTELTAYDAAGAPETIYLARANDRVRKDGAKNSHKVIDKLARSTGDNIRSLAVVHLDEALATSNYKNSTDEHSHQWMDENGWEYRKTYLQDRSGNIYEATLNIADGRDRKILYDVNNIRLIDKAKSPDKHTAAEAKAGETAGGVVPSTASGGARSTSRSVSENRIADRGGNVKPKQRFSARDDALQRRRDRADSRLNRDIDESDLTAQNDAAERRVRDIRNTADEELADAQIAGQERSYEDAEREGKRGDYPSYSAEWKTKLERARAAMQNNIKPSGFDSYDEYIDAVDRQRAADRAERLRIKSKDEFKGTKALDELGVKIANSAGIYHNTEQLIANDRAAKSIQRATARAEQRLGATKREKVIARDIANGERAMSDIPGSVNKSRVLELADYYTAQKATKTGLLQQQRIEITDALREQAGELIGNEAPEINRKGLAKLFDPSKGLVLYHRTPQRIMRALFGWERGQKINEAVFEPVYENEQERKRFINRMFDEVRTFAGTDGKKSALNKEESAFAQKLKEGRTVEELVEKSGDAEKIRKAAENLKKGSSMTDEAKEFGLDQQARDLARRYAEWLQTQDDYAAAKNVDRTKVENAIDKYTELYDKLYAAINDFLVAHGYEPIGFIKGYAPHFQTNEVNGKLESALKAIGVDLGAGVGKLPTSIAGLTKSFKPNKRYNPFFQHRRGTETDYDIVKGFETYVDYASDVLYHTDDIMRVRQMANYLRSTFAPEESKAEIDQMEAIRYAPADVKEEYLRDKKKISRDSFLNYEDLTAMMEQYADEKYRSIEDATEFSDLVSWMDDYANKLAGKQLFEDRAMEREVGREKLNLAKKLNRMFARANVAGNLSSALNQTAQLPMIASELGQKYTWRAVADIARGKTTGMSAFRGESDFLTEKSGIDYIQSTKGDKALELLFSPLEKVDTLVSTIAVRGKYRQELDAGKSPKEAMKAADRWARDIMGTRSKGSVPLTFQSKNLIAQMLNMFQVEAANTLEHVTQDRLGPGFKEMAAKIGKDKVIKKLASDAIAYMLLAFLLNRLDEDTYGGTPAPFDFLGMGLNAVASGNGLASSDMLKMIADDVTENIFGERLFDTDPNDMNDEFDGWSAAEDTLYNISNDVPYVRNVAGLMGWGDQTLPMPDIVGAAGKTKDALKNADSAGEFWAEVAKQLVGLAGDTLPGGRQAEKMLQGGDAVIRGGSYQGFGDSKRLQYPVNSLLEDPFEALRAALFGKNALNESRVYWAEGGKALSASQTALYQELVDSGMSRKKAYETIGDFNDATADLEADKDENGNPISGSKKEKVIEAINKLPLNRKQKDKLYLSKNYSEKDLVEMPWN